MEAKIFYRISHEDTHQGVWYDIDGNFTGFIHNEFSFCKNNDLRMDFDPLLRGYLSAADNLEILDKWFSTEDILKLQSYGGFVHKYESKDYWFYKRFDHFVIGQKSMRLLEKIIYTDEKLKNMKVNCVRPDFNGFSAQPVRQISSGIEPLYQPTFKRLLKNG